MANKYSDEYYDAELEFIGEKCYEIGSNHFFTLIKFLLKWHYLKSNYGSIDTIVHEIRKKPLSDCVSYLDEIKLAIGDISSLKIRDVTDQFREILSFIKSPLISMSHDSMQTWFAKIELKVAEMLNYQEQFEVVRNEVIKNNIFQKLTIDTQDNDSELNFLITKCISTLDIISPEKELRFKEILLKSIENGYFIILHGLDNKKQSTVTPCIYEQNANELKLRKSLVAFAEVLKNENIVNSPKNSGTIPTSKYIKAFGYSLNKETVSYFNYRAFSNQCSEENLIKNNDFMQLWRKRIDEFTSN